MTERLNDLGYALTIGALVLLALWAMGLAERTI